MKRLPPEKRNQLILVIIASLAVILMIYFFLIGPQIKANHEIAAKIVAERDRLEKIKNTVKIAESTAQRAAENKSLLAQQEQDVASGDLFAWTYDTLRRFKTPYHIEIPSIGQPVLSDVDMIPNFPYKQIKFSIVGTGYYHDIGKFVADLENKFPHLRVNSLVLDPTGGPEASAEKLAFRIELVALVKPTA